MNVRAILRSLGAVYITLGVWLVVPAVYQFCVAHEISLEFLIASGVTNLLGASMLLVKPSSDRELSHRSCIAMIALAWISVILLGALPYILSSYFERTADSLFESAAGFTGTAISALRHVEHLPEPLLLWRSLTQWIGGFATIAMYLVLFPALAIGGLQIARVESITGQKERLLARLPGTVRTVGLLYVILTALLALLLTVVGSLSPFDAINHACTALSTGGFSTRDGGLATFQEGHIQLLMLPFLLCGSLNFALGYRLLLRGERSALSDSELRFYVSLIAAAAVLIIVASPALWSLGKISEVLFTTVNVATSSGFTNSYESFSVPIATLILPILAIVGAMSGSAGGGVKALRVLVMVKQAVKEIRHLTHPRAVFALRMNGQNLPSAVLEGIWSTVLLFLLVGVTGLLLLTAFGMSVSDSYTYLIGALFNNGLTAATDVAAPDISASAKLTLSTLMVLGKVELFPLLLLFLPGLWRK